MLVRIENMRKFSKSVATMTRKEFEAVPKRKWDEDIGAFDSIVILPQRKLHNSQFRCLDFVAVVEDKPLARLSGCSDILHIEGIGGYGKNWLNKYAMAIPTLVPVGGWSIDCLRVSGLLRVFCQGKMTVV